MEESLFHSTDSLRGEVVRILYENPDNGYCVLRIADAQGNEQTVRGFGNGITTGQHIEAEGVWENHAEYGRQLRMESCRAVLPSTADGIRRYLASGAIPGVGETLAERIVEHFGDRTLDILDNYSNRLLEVPKLGRKKVAAIREAWLSQKARREADIYLQGLGISAAYCRKLFQRYGDRIVVIEPPPEVLTPEELDKVHELPYARMPHPKYKGRIPAFETIKDSIQAVRGCPGGCAFCGLVVHQGRHVMSRSEDSIMRELDTIADQPFFRGTVSDVGGAAGNIYQSRYDLERCRRCRRSSCLYPVPCSNYTCTGLEIVRLLRRMSAHPKVKHVYINSGIRLDLALRQPELLRELITKHVSGHLKVAPEHLNPEVLKLMRKSSAEEFYKFMELFEKISKECGKEQYLIPLFISNFPGCSGKEMKTAVNGYLQTLYDLKSESVGGAMPTDGFYWLGA